MLPLRVDLHGNLLHDPDDLVPGADIGLARILPAIDELKPVNWNVPAPSVIAKAIATPATNVSPGNFTSIRKPSLKSRQDMPMVVSPDFFEVLEIPILYGRAFSDTDAGGTEVAVVSGAMARV